jgi:hypothetical protein
MISTNYSLKLKEVVSNSGVFFLPKKRTPEPKNLTGKGFICIIIGDMFEFG